MVNTSNWKKERELSFNEYGGLLWEDTEIPETASGDGCTVSLYLMCLTVIKIMNLLYVIYNIVLISYYIFIIYIYI